MKKDLVEQYKEEVDGIIFTVIEIIHNYIAEKKEDDKLDDLQARMLVSHTMDGVFYSLMDSIFNTYAGENIELIKEFNRFIREKSDLKKLAEVYKDKDYIPLVNLYFALPVMMKEIREKL